MCRMLVVFFFKEETGVDIGMLLEFRSVVFHRSKYIQSLGERGEEGWVRLGDTGEGENISERYQVQSFLLTLKVN